METVIEKRSSRQYEMSLHPETVVAFEQWEAEQPGDDNYEFYYGEIIKKSGMKQLEAFIATYLIRCFLRTNANVNEDGFLLTEIDIYVDEQRKRIADLAFFSQQQIVAMGKGAKEIPLFAIELLSDNESFKDTELKVKDYFDAGVQLVWYISPATKRIYAHTSANKIQIFIESDTATADPVLPDFKVEIDKLFTPA